LQIAPNPASGTTYLYMESGLDASAKIVIRDLSGRIVKRIDVDLSIGENIIPVQINEMLNGQYNITVTSNENQWKKKLIKQ
jgi:Secretion system C-terminal sorting domain